MDLAIYAWRFHFVARETIKFPQGTAANVVRGGFGLALRSVCCTSTCPGASQCDRRQTCSYARVFEPKAASKSPSGLADWPRPFVLRVSHLNGVTIAPTAEFSFNVHVFLRSNPELQAFEGAFQKLAEWGLGPTRGRAELVGVKSATDQQGTQIFLSLSDAPVENVSALQIQFLTPTELKSKEDGVQHPSFATVYARARERVANLSALYGAGPLQLDFRETNERARNVRIIRYDVRDVEVERVSSRTGQRHPIGGFIGTVDYQGALDEFLPILRAAEWTGIGRQTVWGKGEIRCIPL